MTYPTKKLGEVCETFTDGDWIESKDQSSSGIRLIQTGNIGQGIFLNKVGKSRFISEQTFKRLNCTEIFPGDLLISRLPDPVGRSCIIPETGTRMITAVDCTIVRVDEKKILREFLLFYTNSSSYHTQIRERLSGTTRQRISRGNLAEIQIPLPPIAEQRKIVAQLEKVLGKIKEAKKLREEAESAAAALLPAELHKIFFEGKKKGWEEKELSELVGLFGGFAFKSGEYSSEGFPVLRMGNISRDFQINWDKKRQPFIDKQRKNEFEKYILNGGELVIGLTDMSDTGNFLGVVAFNDRTALLNQRVSKFVFNTNSLDKRFLYYSLRDPDFRAYATSDNTGSMQRNTSHAHILKYRIILPPLAEQKKIVARLDALSAKVQTLRQAQAKTTSDFTALEQSVLHQAFYIK